MRQFLGLALLLAGASVTMAQQPACVPTRSIINAQGAKADIAVAATAIQVLDSSTVACQRLIRNNGTAGMRCLPTAQGAPTSTDGLQLLAGEQILFGTEGRQAWQCIRTTGTSTTATTIEAIP